jgi:Rrf2 family transcriptional regulator, iron-sulfur cluster assembly transcription factor
MESILSVLPMLFTRGNQYAIQALVLLARQPSGVALMCRDMADLLQIPYPYLSKLMQECAKLGLIGSSRGRTGGYWSLDTTEAMTIIDIVATINGGRRGHDCLLGLKECADDSACVMHGEWKPLKEGMEALLRDQTLSQLAIADDAGRVGPATT